jgi:hypothetical protein
MLAAHENVERRKASGQDGERSIIFRVLFIEDSVS